MHRTVGFALTCVLLIAGLSPVIAAEAQKVPKVELSDLTKQQYLDLAAQGFDIIRTAGSDIELLAHPGDLDKLRSLGIPYRVTVPDLSAFYAARSTAAYGGFRTFSQIVAFLDSLSTAYPTLVSPKFSIGQSIEGRDQWVVRISNNPGVDQGKPAVFYNSLIHAREPEGADMLLFVMKYLVTHYGTDPTVTSIINTRELYFLPVVNPDGYVYNEMTNPTGGGLWRKNRRVLTGGQYGIDLNRNFGYTFGYDDIGSSGSTSSETYRGASAFSEPETQNMMNFVASHSFAIIHNIHTYSNLVLWPWGHDRIYTDREDFYTLIGDSMTKDNHYTPGVSWTLYPTNGDADDWAWGDTITKPRSVTMTTEIGTDVDGFWPAPSRIPTLDSENLSAELFLARIADNPYIIAPPNKPTPHVPDSVGSTYRVTWSHSDPINPAVSYRLMEFTGKQTVADPAESDLNYWSLSHMGLSSARKHNGNSSWHSLNTNNTAHWLLGNTPYLVKPNDSLRFWLWYDIESGWDFFYAQVSLDGGNSFINLPNNLTTNSNLHNTNHGNGITGQSTVWTRAAFDLSPYVGKQVIIRLVLITDSYTLGEGVYLDDIENVDLYSSQSQVASGVIDTFYQFSGRPDGQYWYRVAATDAQGQEGRLSDFVATQVKQVASYVVGDLSADGVVDGTDLAMLVSYLTAGGTAPNPIGRGNLDCSGIVDGADLAYMVGYLTSVSAAPSCP